MEWLIGIDGGGTKTVGYAADFTGKIMGKTEAGASNYHTTGIASFKEVISKIINELAAGCRLPLAGLKVVSLGLAGADRPEDKKILLTALQELGFSCHYLIASDARAALTAGLGQAEGIVLIAGTGSVAYGINSQGEVIRAGGWGHLASDEGSGYFIGQQALVRSIRATEARDTATMLLAMIMEHFGVTSWDKLIRFINDRNLTKSAVASVARVVAVAAQNGDQVAAEILDAAAAELAGLVKSVLQRGFAGESKVSVCAYGSIVQRIPAIGDRLAAALGPGVTWALAEREPAEGAVQLALEWARRTS